jgi:uncharacterized protein YndB with AHSA1/START domain
METMERVSTGSTTEVHNTFVLEREYPVPVAAVWHALSDSDARNQWFGGGSEFTEVEKSHDFRVGGQAVEDGEWHGGPRSRYVGTYTDIVEERRIVSSYDMWLDDRHISTSSCTMALEPTAYGTRLTYTEQGVHLDGLDSPAQREEGTAGLLDQLGAFLAS